MLTGGISAASSGMKALIDMNDVIANNIANVNTNGFKRSNVVFQNIYNRAIEEKSNATNPISTEYKKVGELSSGVKAQDILLQFTQGTLQQTGNPFDLGIEGDGFFKIQDKEGNITYTRNGSFVLNSEKCLTTKDGEYVLDKLNKKIVVDLKKLPMDSISQLVINEKGTIMVNNPDNQIILQDIFIADFSNKEDLIPLGGAKYKPSGNVPNPELRAEKYSIQQHTLEASNSNIITEMINMIKVSRNYETLSKFVKSDSERLSRAIMLGRLSQ